MPDQHDPRDADSGQVGVGWGDDGVVVAVRNGRARVARALARTVEIGRVGLDDGDLEPGEAQRRRMDAGEAELEHVRRRLSEQLDDPRRRRGGKSRRQPAHSSWMTAIAHTPSSAAPRVKSAVTAGDPWRSDAVCQMPGRAMSPSART